MPQIHIRQWPHPVPARGPSILDAALRAGVPYPHACRVGECGGCKTRLYSGRVEMQACDPAALSAAEREAGLILACRARATTDVELAWAPDRATTESPPPVQRQRLRVASIELAAPRVTVLRLHAKRQPVQFLAGQFGRLRFGRLPSRSYSMANVPGESTLEFHIRHVDGGLASQHVARALKVGDLVDFEGPFGNSFLRRDHAGPIVAVAGGTGLAPMLSIVRTTLQAPQRQPLSLYFGVRDEDDVYLEDTLKQLRREHANFSFEVVLSAPQHSSSRRIALLPQLLLEAPRIAGPNTMLYAAGSSAMINSLATVATTIGIPAERLLADRFVPSSTPAPTNFLQRAVSNIVAGWGGLLHGR